VDGRLARGARFGSSLGNARRARIGSPLGNAGRESGPGIAGNAVPENCFSPRAAKEPVHAPEELAIELREVKQPGQLADLRERHVHPQDSPNGIKDRQASRNRYKSAWVGHQHVFAGTFDREEVLHGSNHHATKEDCPRTDDVAAANQSQTRKSSPWDRLHSRERLNSGYWGRWGEDGWDRGRRDWARWDSHRRNRLSWIRRERLNWGPRWRVIRGRWNRKVIGRDRLGSGWRGRLWTPATSARACRRLAEGTLSTRQRQEADENEHGK
jgi:hypothetical protein